MTRTLGHGTTLVSLQMTQNWEQVSDTQDGCAAIQRNLNRLQKWAGRNLMKLKKKIENAKLSPLAKINSLHQVIWGQPAGKQLMGISDGC